MIGMSQILNDILNSINGLKLSLENSMSNSDIGFDTDNLRGRERNRRSRRNTRRSRSPRRTTRGRVGRGVLGGLIGVGLGWGASELLGLDDDTATDLEIGGGAVGAGAGALSKGASAAGESSGWLGKIGKLFTGGTAGKVLGKVAAPLTIASTLSDNWDELQKTGAVNPLEQGKKAIGGLGKVFSIDKPFFSLDRLEGAGDAISGATGAVLGAGTQVGKAINSVIPTDLSDKIVDSVVGLFGGETNADREKKRQEIETRLNKELEEKKKKREETKASPLQEQTNKVKDSAVIPVDKVSTTVQISQPGDKPIPVVMTDEKGNPIISSVDVKESKIPQSPIVTKIESNKPVASTLPSNPITDILHQSQSTSVPQIQQAQSRAQDADAIPQQVQIPKPPVSTQEIMSKRVVSGSYTPSDDDKKYFSGDIRKLKGMDPVFVSKLKAASEEAGVKLPLTSGYRSQEKQDQLRAEAVKKYGSEEAASKWVAKTSIHTTGNAADFSMGGDAKKFWDDNPDLVKAMEKQGLHRPLSHEAWHWESDVTKGENRKGLADKLIAQRQASLSSGQVLQDTAAGAAGMLAANGVPGASSISSAIISAPNTAKKLTKITDGMSLADMLSVHESKGNYNIFNQGKGHGYKQGEKDFSKMTLNEVMAQQNLSSKDPNKLFAIGKYQIIPSTLKAAAKSMKLTGDEKFTPELQDKIFQEYLVEKKQKSIGNYIKTGKNLDKAAHASAAEWASVGAAEKGGASLYGGPNKAFVSPEQMKKTLTESREKYTKAISEGKTPEEAMRLATLGTSKPQSNINPETPTKIASSKTNNSLQSEQTLGGDVSTSEYKGSDAPNKDIKRSTNVLELATHQSDSYTHNLPGHQYSQGQLSRNGISTHRTNANYTNPIKNNTVSGLTPKPAPISIKSDDNLSPREAQNNNLLSNQNVKASIDALKSNGGLGNISPNDSVEQIRQKGGLDSLINGDIPSLVNKVAPNISNSINGVKSVFNQNLTGSISSQSLTPFETPDVSPSLEMASISDKQSDIKAGADMTAMNAMLSQTSGRRSEPSRGSLERGSNIMDGQTTGMEVRNNESSLRRLTDMIIAFSFG